MKTTHNGTTGNGHRHGHHTAESFSLELVRLARIKERDGEREYLLQRRASRRLLGGMPLKEIDERIDEINGTGKTDASAEDAAALLNKAVAPAQRDEIVQIAEEGDELWHDPDATAFSTIAHGGHWETWPVRSTGYRHHLLTEYRSRHGRVPGGQAVSEGIETIEAIACDRLVRNPFIRIGSVDDGSRIYLDLCRDDWSVVEIDRDGWRILPRSPVPFLRPPGLRALPVPSRTADALGDLRKLINLPDDEDFMLFVAWLVGCLRRRGPFPILVVNGEQGSAKTSLLKIARRLVDPGKIVAAAPPASEEDLAIRAEKAWVFSLDNISKVNGYLPDALCRLATGGGFPKRKLFTDDDQVLIDICRPAALNGIPDFAVQPDFADRSIILVLRPLPKGTRREEEEVERDVEAAAPGVLALLLDGAAAALKGKDAASRAIKEKPRMADFATSAAAAVPTFGWTAEQFLRGYNNNRANAVERVIEADPVARAIREFARKLRAGTGKAVWTGTATALLVEINMIVPEDIRKEREWPKDGTRLGNRARRGAAPLRQLGVHLNFARVGHDGARLIEIHTE